MKNINSQGFAHQALILVLVVLAGVGGAGWYVYQKQNTKNDRTDASVQKSTDATSEQQSTDDSEKTTEVTIPEGWKEYKDTQNGISFYYPASFDEIDAEYPEWMTDSQFRITRSPIAESFLGPYGGGGGGVSYFFNTNKNTWYRHEPNETMQQGAALTGYSMTTSKLTKYPVLFGQAGEGGGGGYFFLIANEKYAYQIVLPGIIEEAEAEAEKTMNELKDAVPGIIETIKFLN